MRQEIATPKMQQAFEKANPRLRLRDDADIMVLGGLLIDKPNARWGLTHMPGSVLGRIEAGENWYSMGIDHTTSYWCSSKKRYVLIGQPYARLPECQQPEACGCLVRLMEYIDVINAAHANTKAGQRNGEKLQVYIRGHEYAWHPGSLLVVIASITTTLRKKGTLRTSSWLPAHALDSFVAMPSAKRFPANA